MRHRAANNRDPIRSLSWALQRALTHDLLGVKHKDGTLEADAPPPPAEKKLREAVQAFRAAGDDADRDLLMRAFAAQDAVEWPVLEALLGGEVPAPAPAPAKPAGGKAKPAPRRARKPS